MTNQNTLENEIKEFADKLPYWSKYLANKILIGKAIKDGDIDQSYLYLLEELNINEKSSKEAIEINCRLNEVDHYAQNLVLSSVANVKGVNALADNQVIEFGPNLTIIYGINGSGKSGYIRLFKSVFYSKAPEEILQNINKADTNNTIDAEFVFTTGDLSVPLSYKEKDKAVFKQFSVFDGKGIFKQLSEKNQFEFRPAGLSFFAYFSESIRKVEEKLKDEIQRRNPHNEYEVLFDGNSEIKIFIKNISEKTSLADLQKYIPFSEEDRLLKQSIQKQYDDLLLISKDKETQITKLQNIKKFMSDNKKAIETLNSFFSLKKLSEVKEAVSDYLSKEKAAKDQGIESFKSDKINAIGTIEWKNFIKSADAFCRKQKTENAIEIKDKYCLFCHQPLSKEADELIKKYWIFLKSAIEEEVKNSKENINKEKIEYTNLNFDLFPEESVLSAWLIENYPEKLSKLQGLLLTQKRLRENILLDIENGVEIIRDEVQIDLSFYDEIEAQLDNSIKMLKENQQNKELETLLIKKTYLEHKEKYNLHFSKFETYVNQLSWVKKAKEANFGKRRITETEKSLSDKYFNQKYIDAFNEECQKLNGLFDISIDHTGSAGKSFRQLKLKGRTPNAILSEGEQKVLAISDFISEMRLSEINKGIIFDDPVTSLDDYRKNEIGKRLVEESIKKQVIIFTHDLVFVSSLATYCSELNVQYCCHWIENCDGIAGQIWLNNSPSYEKQYRNAEPAKKHYTNSKKDSCPPEQREIYIKSGFTALRTCYEVLVINDLFKNVVQRFNERVSIDSLNSVCFDSSIIKELQDSFAQCCRYMEGHSHSDKFSYKKPQPEDLNEEIERYEKIRSKIRKYKPS